MLHEKVYHDEPELDPEEVTSNSSENESALWSETPREEKEGEAAPSAVISRWALFS